MKKNCLNCVRRNYKQYGAEKYGWFCEIEKYKRVFICDENEKKLFICDKYKMDQAFIEELKYKKENNFREVD